MKFIDDLSHLYASILNEDYQSSVAQPLTILKNNQVQNPETVNSELEKIFNNVRIEEEENRAGKKDTVNLFMDKSGNIKADRLKKSGLTPLLSFTTSYSRMSLFSI